VHTVSSSADNLLNPKSKSLTALKSKYIFSQKDWKEKELQSKDKLKKWEAITGYPLKSLDDVIFLADNLYVRKLHHIAMPDGITNDMANEIIALANWTFLRKFQDYPLAKQTNANFLQKLSADFTDASQNKTSLKYELFSAHDSTILSTLASLRNSQKAPPPYASDVNFLLYKTADQKFYVKIIYNDQPVIIPGCSEKCPLADFKKLIG
jgi:acid phosphatase